MAKQHESARLLIYGAGGYSGELVASQAAERGLDPILAGRERRSVMRVAERLRLESRIASLGDSATLDAMLRGVSVVLHCAGPFSQTSAPMLEACLRTGTHYLDLTGEIEVVEALVRSDGRARDAGCMVMPGVGLDVVAGDCLALHVSSRLPSASRLSVGVHGLNLVSRGTAKTIIQAAGSGYARRAGELVPIHLGDLDREFDFGWGPTPCMNVYWADVSTAYYTTGIPNIDVYCETTLQLRTLAVSNRAFGSLMATAPWRAWANAHADVLLRGGPDEQQRRRARAVFVAEVEAPDGRRAASRLSTPGAYTFTAFAAPSIAARVLAGDVEPGFQTPARVYGANLPLGFEGVVREDLH